MSAKKTGGTASRKRNKDMAMAADLRARGVQRTTYRDPITGQIVPIGTVPGSKKR